MSFLLVTVATVVLLSSVSCGPGAEESGRQPAVSLDRVDAKGLSERIQAHRGEVVVVDVWATWCVPCVEAWPEVLRLRDEYGGEGLAILSLSVNKPEKADEVRGFLASEGNPGEALLLEAENFNEFVGQVGREWEGGVPAMLLHDRDGKLRHEFIGAGAVEKAEPRIRELLGLTGEGEVSP